HPCQPGSFLLGSRVPDCSQQQPFRDRTLAFHFQSISTISAPRTRLRNTISTAETMPPSPTSNSSMSSRASSSTSASYWCMDGSPVPLVATQPSESRAPTTPPSNTLPLTATSRPWSSSSAAAMTSSSPIPPPMATSLLKQCSTYEWSKTWMCPRYILPLFSAETPTAHLTHPQASRALASTTWTRPSASCAAAPICGKRTWPSSCAGT
ncbi:hypothetical protein EV182_008301, partial [Spiromyces aspiralis]